MGRVKFKNLKDVRNSLNLTQLDVAKSSGITEAHYNLIENGNRKPSLDVAYKIANALKISMDDFFILLNLTKCEEVS